MKKPHIPGQLGLFKPESDWRPPAELPDLRGRPLVAIDTEERDLGLASGRGPGWPLGPAGYVAGVGYAADGASGYVPVRHPETECFPRENVARWLSDLFASGTRIVFHNATYDVGWLSADLGVAAPVLMEDTLAAVVMDDENHRDYSLDGCCLREGVPGKNIELLREAVRAYGGNPARPQADLWQIPARYAGPYGEADPVATLGLWRQLEPRLHAAQVWAAYRTEIELIPLMVEMRRRGIRLDVDLAMQTQTEFLRRRDAVLSELTRHVGGRQLTMGDIRSPKWLSAAFGAYAPNLALPRTAGGSRGAAGARDSFSKGWMEKADHWLPRLLVDAVKYEDAANKFIGNYLLDFSHRGRLHAEIHQFRSDEGGTRSHRLSYSDPPLQQMPSADKDPHGDLPHAPGLPEKQWRGKGELLYDKAIGTLIRKCFLPEEGAVWLSPDYSQQEPRLTVHFAAVCRMPGAEEAVRRYIEQPDTDYHQMVADMTGLPRSRSKILNLAMTYGRGKKATAEELGVSLEEAEALLAEYHHRLPFIKPLEEFLRGRAAARGYIRLIDGARMHYPLWEGGWIDFDEKLEAARRGKRMDPCARAEAEERARDPDHPWSRTRLRRADTRKALNNEVQGSAARQTKLAMLALWREGVVPLLQMHDEIPQSVTSEAEVRRAGEIMRDVIKLRVPMKVDLEVGPSWGEAKMSWSAYVKKYGAPQ